MQSLLGTAFLLLMASAAIGQSVSSASFTIGGANVPLGADPSKTSVDIIDWDPISNDVLESGLLGFIAPDTDGNWVTDDVNTTLFCLDGEVAGDAGASGENPSNIFVRVTFRDANNKVLKVVDSGTQNVRCI
jgi:hypothetical protein